LAEQVVAVRRHPREAEAGAACQRQPERKLPQPRAQDGRESERVVVALKQPRKAASAEAELRRPVVGDFRS